MYLFLRDIDALTVNDQQLDQQLTPKNKQIILFNARSVTTVGLGIFIWCGFEKLYKKKSSRSSVTECV